MIMDGFVVDIIFIGCELLDDDDEKWWGEWIIWLIERILCGEEMILELVVKKGLVKGCMKVFKVVSEVLFDNFLFDDYIVLEIFGLDWFGLLYDLIRLIVILNFNIGFVYILMFGEKVVDVFYVIDLMG